MIFEARKSLAAMHQRHFAAKRVRKLASSMAESPPPITMIFLPRVEEAVAGGAGADAVANQLLLVRQAQPARGRARSDDQRAGFDPFALDIQPVWALGKVGLGDGAVQIFGAKFLGLLADVLHQIRAVNAFGKAGEILDQGGERKLPAGLVAVDDQRIELRARHK